MAQKPPSPLGSRLKSLSGDKNPILKMATTEESKHSTPDSSKPFHVGKLRRNNSSVHFNTDIPVRIFGDDEEYQSQRNSRVMNTRVMDAEEEKDADDENEAKDEQSEEKRSPENMENLSIMTKVNLRSIVKAARPQWMAISTRCTNEWFYLKKQYITPNYSKLW